MKLTDRLYWFFRNLIAFTLIILFSPFTILIAAFRLIGILLVTDGSEVLCFPWEK